MKVGPDGNIYVGSSSGMGIFSLTPQGQLRWQTPEPYNRPNVDKSELAFGLNNGAYQLYFYGNAHLRAIRLSDGASIFTGSGSREPRVSPVDQSVHYNGTALRPDGTTLWVSDVDFSFANPDVGTDGTHYVTARGLNAVALKPDGTVRWSHALPDDLGAVNVDPANRVLVGGGNNSTLGGPAHIVGLSTANGAELWRIFLPLEDAAVPTPWLGTMGYPQYVNTRAAFTPDSATAYIGTVMSSGGPGPARSFLYSIALGGATNQPPLANIAATPTTGSAPLGVNFASTGSSDPDGTITAYAWNFGDGTSSTAANSSHTYANAGTYIVTLTVTDNAGATASASTTITVTPATAQTLRSTAVNLSAFRNGGLVRGLGQVVVRDATNTAVPGANVNVTWTRPGGTPLTQTATTSSSGIASFNTSGARGTYTLTVNNLSKTGGTFDKANSILSNSITK
jgi:PKD repeat protein